ncbi:YCII domain protein [Melioribacter roseus P3M-2]|uniref:YCII domain protein n=1 Tax=Melioribacter roseus (strain DSM 23840 / JCM 17771 / VKM B-2668 / P3M-2) TaxID=1191523 RepID=I6ZNV8_MELRP|nr:YciI family protein [Melioribacter roseus]AFN73709.1 YCII domain protein [Melioribacter roseus P3M-2]
MKNSNLMPVIIALVLSVVSVKTTAQNNGYDSTLAKRLGADQYGMKKYVTVFLYRGDVKIEDESKRSEIQKAHLKNITKLAEEKKLILAGPFLDDSDMRGIFIFDVESLDEARRLTESDPAVKAGVLKMEIKSWYGSAAVMMIPEIHSKLSRLNIAD